jgi:hypothetical protein
MTGVEKLKEIGAQRIYEQTHIAKKYVEDILNHNFSSMSKIQFSGFISILEREYHVDLQEITEAYHAQLVSENKTESEPFVVSEQEVQSSKIKGSYLIAGGILAGIIAIIFVANSSSEESLKQESKTLKVISVENELNNTTIEEAKSHLNRIEVPKAEEVKPEENHRIEPMHSTKFEVIPRSKLWIGIVDLENFKRTQKLTDEPFELDADKEWLLVMGHGYVNFFVNEEEQKFKDENKVWFAYENGSLSKITRSEFKEKNRGKAW